MPNYWNPNNFYPATYPQYSTMPMQQPQMMSGAPAQVQNNCAMAWVTDEMEARGRQMPAGVMQFAMWDTNQNKIYLKSLNQMGIPNPMQILHYTIEEAQANLPAGGQSGAVQPDMSQYVTRQDFEQLQNELHQLRQQNQSGNTVSNTSGSNGNTTNNYGVTGTSNQNRGGNR